MILVELTRIESKALREILLGICLNSGKDNVNSSAAKIVAQDLNTYKPDSLLHCYTSEELTSILQIFLKKPSLDIKAREIIKSINSLGIVRQLYFNEEKPDTLVNSIYKYYRYYVICSYQESGVNRCTIITYNPDITELNAKNIQLNKSLKVNCGVMQLGNIGDFKRALNVCNVIKEYEGTYTIYSL